MIESVDGLRKICLKSEEKYGKIPLISRKLIHPHISIRITRLLLILGFSGLRATVLMLLTNIIALLALFIGMPVFYAIGGTLLILAWILDHVDGEVCRYRKESTSLGIYLDNFTHQLTYPAIYLILGYSLFRDIGNIHFLYVGIVASYFLSLTACGRIDKKKISFFRKDIVFNYSSLQVAVDIWIQKSGCFRFLLYPIKYFVGMFMSGFGSYFDIALIICALMGIMEPFFIFFSIVVVLNWLLIFIFDIKYTFVKDESNMTLPPDAGPFSG